MARKKLVWSAGDAHREFTRDGSDWKEAGRAIPAASVEDVLTAIGSLEGKDFLPAPDWQNISGAPELAAFSVETSAGDSFSAAVRPSGGGNVADRPQAVVLPAADFERVAAAVRKIAPAAAPPAKAAPPSKPVPPPKKPS